MPEKNCSAQDSFLCHRCSMLHRHSSPEAELVLCCPCQLCLLYSDQHLQRTDSCQILTGICHFDRAKRVEKSKRARLLQPGSIFYIQLLIISRVNLEIALCMFAYRANLRCFLANHDVTAVAALPNHILIL